MLRGGRLAGHRRGYRRTGARIVPVVGALTFVGSLSCAASAAAITPTITEYSYSAGLNAGSCPGGIAPGPDGNLWFTDACTPAIGRITPSGVISEFGTANGLNPGSSPTLIAAGPDGKLWFTDTGTTKAIGQINPTTQAIHEFTLSASIDPIDITAGPDGNLWFTDQGSAPAIGRITTGGVVTEFGTANGLNPGSSPARITAGPDGNLWFTDQGTTKAIGQINPTTQAIVEFSAGLSSTNSPQGIAVGPDGNLWFADRGATRGIGRITPTGQISEFSAGLNPGGRPRAIAAGPDGHVWFADEGTTKAIGRIDPTTQVIGEFSAGLTAGNSPREIAQGPDGNLWFTETGTTAAIARITTPPTAVTTSVTATGQTTATVAGTANGHAQATSFQVEYGPIGGSTATTPERSLGTISADTPVSARLSGLTPGRTYRARVVVTNPTDTTAGAFLSFTTAAAPALSNLRVSPRRFSLAGRKVNGRCVKPTRSNSLNQRCRRPIRLRVSYTLNVSTTVTFTLKRQAPGRKVNGRCVKPTKKNDKHRKCTRLVRVPGKITRASKAGANHFTFNGKIGGHKLGPGTYQLIATPTGGKPRKVTFRIVS